MMIPTLKAEVSESSEIPPLEFDINPEQYVQEIQSTVDEIVAQGYVGPEHQIPENSVLGKSPVYTVEAYGADAALRTQRTIEKEKYVGQSLEDQIRMEGPLDTPEEVIEAIEGGNIFLEAKLQSRNSGKSPEFKVKELPIEPDILESGNVMGILQKVHEAISDSEHALRCYDLELDMRSTSNPRDALEQLEDFPLRVSAVVLSETPYHLDVGYLRNEREGKNYFGIEARNEGSKRFDAGSENIVDVVEDLSHNLGNKGIEIGLENSSFYT